MKKLINRTLEEIEFTMPILQCNIIIYLSENGSKTREKMVNELNTPRTTLYDNLEKLERKELIWRLPKSNEKIGRSSVYWQIKHAHNLVIFKQIHNIPNKETIKTPVFKISDWFKTTVLNELNEIKNAKKPIKTLKKENKKKPKLIKKIKKTNLILKKPKLVKKDNEKTSSYILNNKNTELVKYILDEINKCTYFRTTTLSKHYINKFLKGEHAEIEGKIKRSTANKVGRIVKELRKLGIVTTYSSSTWKNLHKDQLHSVLNKKMNEIILLN